MQFDKKIPVFLLTGLSLSIGWGIRGNFGHEFGAMIPGALAAMAVVLLSGRDDWHRRIAWFGMFGALGWSFGGSMSYGQVIGYTLSGDSLSVFYGFASLFLIGFLWAAMGGAGTALPAILDRSGLNQFMAPLTAVFAAWFCQDLFENILVATNPDYRQQSPLYWYDTDWLAALTAIIAIALLALVRRRWDEPSSLILHMAAGWWIGFGLLVLVLGWRMTPPRGDNWAGCAGMTVGMWIYFNRRGLKSIVFASLLSAFFGGFGFATAALFQLVELKSGWNTNWHSVLEQTYGLINGLGIAAAMLYLSIRAPRNEDFSRQRNLSEIYPIGFVLLLIPWLNLTKNPEFWIRAGSVPEILAGLRAQVWFDLAFLFFAVVAIGLMFNHRMRPLPFIPANWLGKGQLLYLAFLWFMLAGNFAREIVVFVPQRLVTEGTIFFNASFCTLLMLLYSNHGKPALEFSRSFDYGPMIRRTAITGLIATALSLVIDWGIVRAIYGDQPARESAKNIRFGPRATATTEKPKAGQPHP